MSDATARMMEAMRLQMQGELDQAEIAYRSLLADMPGQPDILHSLGVVYLQRESFIEAADFFREALKSNPNNPRSLLALSRALTQLGDINAASEVLCDILTLDPTHTESIEGLFALCAKHLPEDVEDRRAAAVEALIKRHPNVHPLRYIALRLYQAIDSLEGRMRHATMLYNAGIRSDQVVQQYALALRDTAEYNACIRACDEGLLKTPDSLELLKLRGGILLAVGRHQEALRDWAAALALAPNDEHSVASLGIIKLLLSDCTDGFDEYGAHRDHELKNRNIAFTIPEWRGEKLAGKHLLIWCSQGIGDVIMFASMIPWVIAQNATITLACYPKLIPLFERAFPSIRVVQYTTAIGTTYSEECDFHIIIGELMRYVLPVYTPAAHGPYLKADTTRSTQLRESYFKQAQALGKSPKRLVGISWYTQNKVTYAQRNIPLPQWKKLFSLTDIQFISLQYGDADDDIAAINRLHPNCLLSDTSIDAYGDTDALAAQIAAMDEVVSIQNATVHLAGALGIPTTILLSAASDWRWGLKRTDSRWYSSVTIERQEKLFDWKPALERVYNGLKMP